MDRNKRMAQTLGCLVASMTVGAVVLQWGQPNSAGQASAPPLELVAVHITQSWSSIQIVPSGPDGRFDPRVTHFFVDSQGRWSPTESWRSQSQAGGKGMIRIALEPSPDSNQIAEPQWETTQRLRKVLCKECQIPARNVRIHDTLAVPAGAGRPKSARNS